MGLNSIFEKIDLHTALFLHEEAVKKGERENAKSLKVLFFLLQVMEKYEVSEEYVLKILEMRLRRKEEINKKFNTE
jgi:hypothetical protein